MAQTRPDRSRDRPWTQGLVVQAKLFGPVELSDQWGSVVERPARRPLPWLLLKSLLANPGREVSGRELDRELWPERAKGSTDNNLRVRLHRLRESLAPLGLDGPEGLVLSCGGRIFLNPDIPVQTDTEQFTALLRREGALPTGDPEGLALCAQALELYRGAFLEHTAPAPWLDAYRAQYARQFRTLAWRTLRRMDAVGADGPLELLCRRAAWAAPGDSALHGELIRCLAQYQRQVELIRHVAQLKLSRGKEQN